MKVLGVLFGLLALSAAHSKRYDGYKVFETQVLDIKQVEALRSLEARSIDIDFWKPARPGMKAKIMVAPSEFAKFERFMKLFKVDHEITIQDVQSTFLDHNVNVKSKVLGKMTWDAYYTFDELIAWIEELAATYEFCEVVELGTTYEGNVMKALEIKKAPEGSKTVFIEAGIHAREWISPAVATYTINELLTNYEAHPEYIDDLNWFYIPSANPDGYEYTWSTDRLWRKNREPSPNPAFPNCVGTDLNRNWGFHWHESGVSDLPCASTYPGAEPMDTAEAQIISTYFDSVTENYGLPEIAICFHSAANLWLYPYGYAYNTQDQIPNSAELIEVCEQAVAALNGDNDSGRYDFECINSADLYPAAGASDDWYKSKGSRLVYTPELRDDGYGFELPPQYIEDSGSEVWAAWKVMLNRILN